MFCRQSLLKLMLSAYFSTFIVSCGTTNTNKRNYEPVVPLKELTVKFVNSKWKKETIPIELTCKAPNHAKTPSLEISHIPEGTNAIIMEYSDKSFFKMDNGGHGKIGYALPDGADEITIPSLPSNLCVLPNGFWIVAKHKNAFDFAKEYPIYMPPCSGGKHLPGQKHQYRVTIKAVYHAPSKNEQSELLAEKKLELGEY